jgi:hypothetical protein
MDEELNEKSVSKAQQALMAQAYAIKIGMMEPSELDPKYRKQITNLAKRMTTKQLEDFASTKTKKLPHYVEESNMEIDESDGIILEPIGSDSMPKFIPSGPGKIIPFLDPDSKQKKKGKRNLQNLKDYRDWVNDK